MVRHRRQLRCLRHVELARISAEPQHLALHIHEHSLVIGVKRTIHLVREQCSESPARVARQVECDRTDEAFIDPDPFAAADQLEAL